MKIKSRSIIDTFIEGGEVHMDILLEAMEEDPSLGPAVLTTEEAWQGKVRDTTEGGPGGKLSRPAPTVTLGTVGRGGLYPAVVLATIGVESVASMICMRPERWGHMDVTGEGVPLVHVALKSWIGCAHTVLRDPEAGAIEDGSGMPAAVAAVTAWPDVALHAIEHQMWARLPEELGERVRRAARRTVRQMADYLAPADS